MGAAAIVLEFEPLLWLGDVPILWATLAVAAVYISLNEGIANWQAVWCSIGFLVLALTLRQARGAPG